MARIVVVGSSFAGFTAAFELKREHEDRHGEGHGRAPGARRDSGAVRHSEEPETHWARLAFEKYFLATRRRGHLSVRARSRSPLFRRARPEGARER
jgi:glycine/D-amino acid oxidase-like deaminating enzyme